MDWRGLFGKRTLPTWVAWVLTALSAIMNIIERWGDLDFLISDYK